MTSLYLAAAVALLLTWLLALPRIASGPTPSDRVLATQLLGTTGVALVLLLAFAFDRHELVDVALVLAVLALIVSGTFVRRLRLPVVRGGDG